MALFKKLIKGCDIVQVKWNVPLIVDVTIISIILCPSMCMLIFYVFCSVFDN